MTSYNSLKQRSHLFNTILNKILNASQPFLNYAVSPQRPHQTEILNKSPLDNVDQQWLISQYSIQVRPLNLSWCHLTGRLFKIRLT